MNLTLIRLLQQLNDPIIIIVLSIVLSLVFGLFYLIGRASAEKHIIKYHLKEFYDDEYNKLSKENIDLKIQNKDLLEKNKIYMEVFSGMRYLVRKGE